jgi:indole-3-acetate monooxygenase
MLCSDFSTWSEIGRLDLKFHGPMNPQVWEKVGRGEPVSMQDRGELLLAATNATRSAAAAIEIVYTAGGGGANYRRSPLQRQMRDIHAVTQHIGTAPAQYETSGRVLLGLPPDIPLILL